MAELVYGGKSYQYVSTRDFHTTSVMESSGTDEKYLGVRLVVHVVITHDLFPAEPGEQPAQTFARIREFMMTPRLGLLFTSDGKILVNIGDVDPMNGPIPQYCHPVVEHGFGNAAWVVEWCVECALPPCEGNADRPFLTCRWSQTHDVDERGYSRLFTSGRGVVNPNFMKRNLTFPDAFRHEFVPTLIPGFERKYHYVISENNLEFAFSFTDTEKLYAPPNDAIDPTIQFVRVRGKTTLTTMTGALFFITATCEVVGKKKTPKEALIRKAMKVCSDKLFQVGLLRGEGKNNKQYTIQMSIEADMDDDVARVMFRAKAMHPLPIPQININEDNIILAIQRNFDTPKSAQGTAALNVGSRGYSNLQIIAAALGDPCTELVTEPKITSGSSFSKPNAISVPVIPPSLTNTLPPLDGWDKIPGLTEAVHIEASYGRDYGKVQLPVTKTAAGGASSVVVQTNDAVMTKTFGFSIEKVGTPPGVPDLRSYDPNLVLLDDTHTPVMMDQKEDGQVVYTLTGSATYAILDPTKAKAGYPVPPWKSFSYADFIGIFNQVVPMTNVDPASLGTLDGSSLFPPIDFLPG